MIIQSTRMSMSERKIKMSEQYIALKDFKMSYDHINIVDVRKGEKLNVPDHLVYGLVKEGFVTKPGSHVKAQTAAPENKMMPSHEDKAGIATDSGEQFSDRQLRDAIKEATGKSPAGRASRETLIEQFNQLNAAE
jgi:hypothetical protein